MTYVLGHAHLDGMLEVTYALGHAHLDGLLEVTYALRHAHLDDLLNPDQKERKEGVKGHGGRCTSLIHLLL